MNLRSPVVLVVLLGGCGPQTTDTGATTEAGSASTVAGSSSTDAPTTGSPTTGSPTTGSPTTGSPTTGEPTTGGSECVPGPVAGEVTCQPPGATQAYWSLSFAASRDETVDTECLVLGVEDDGELQTIDLTCENNSAILELFSKAPHVAASLVDGADVVLQSTTLLNDEVPDAWFALRDLEGRLLVAGLQNTVFPELAPLTIAPLTIDVRSSDCDGTGAECFVIQRAALAVATAEDETTVFDGNVGLLGEQSGFAILASRVTRELCYIADCGYNYDPWSADVLIVFTPEG
jgi:hypothetical protein